MTAFVAAYDTEKRDACLSACRKIAAVHRRLGIPATFFIVGTLLEAEGGDYRRLLRQPELFEIASHTYSHGMLRDHPICGDALPLEEISAEILRGKELVEEAFGTECLGLRPACSFDVGLQGARDVLELVREAGLSYVSSQAWGPHYTLPAPLIQAYNYEKDGFPDIWELPCHGWHENVLKGHNATPDRLLLWPPLYPDMQLTGYVTTPAEELAVYRFFIDKAIAEDLEYISLIWHPWSLDRFDPDMEMLDMLFAYAASKGMPFLRYADLWRKRV